MLSKTKGPWQECKLTLSALSGYFTKRLQALDTDTANGDVRDSSSVQHKSRSVVIVCLGRCGEITDLFSNIHKFEQFLESDTAEDFEGAGHRCAFLHRPATSLGKNFKTNISKELDDCCLSLGEITGNDQLGIDNPHRFNFDEAAMLIQRFAFVFGTKVDYLHSQAMHFLETLPPQKTKKTKKIVQEDDERFVVENEAVIDPCDFLDQGLLKACNVESLCSVHAKQLLEDQDCVDVAFAFGENEETGAVTYSVGHRVEVVCKMDDFRMICRFVNSRDSMLKGVLLLHLGHEQVIDDFASDTFVLLWQPHLLSPNENAKRPTVPQEGLVLNFHNQPAGYGRSHLKVSSLRTSLRCNVLRDSLRWSCWQ
uniref:CNDH2_N domain-containing protein n=1 Tax=Angiostrongylus cantonensis TaxID=6313 RepID=A0A0K0D5K1_ANGCA